METYFEMKEKWIEIGIIILKALVLIVSCFILSYFIVSGVNWDMNIMNWDKETRYLTLMFGTLVLPSFAFLVRLWVVVSDD